tara:strand:- start:3410 stop:4018 length:609 start_codon:yes stop_codon:yes gene_type:complete
MADFNNILPSGVNIKSMEFISNQPTVATQSISGRQQIRSFGGQFWSAKVRMNSMSRTALRKVYGFLVKQKGSFNTFTIAPVNTTETGITAVTSEGIASSSTTAQKAVGSTSIELDNVNKFTAGDMIKFNNSGHTKAYMITVDQGSDNTINFEPGLVKAVADTNSVLAGSNFEMTVRLVGDTVSYNVDETGYGTLEFDIVEAV